LCKKRLEYLGLRERKLEDGENYIMGLTMKNAYKILVEKPEKRTLRRQSIKL
jgi:hypothetical protein